MGDEIVVIIGKLVFSQTNETHHSSSNSLLTWQYHTKAQKKGTVAYLLESQLMNTWRELQEIASKFIYRDS